jgi:hypothetical protein
LSFFALGFGLAIAEALAQAMMNLSSSSSSRNFRPLIQMTGGQPSSTS